MQFLWNVPETMAAAWTIQFTNGQGGKMKCTTAVAVVVVMGHDVLPHSAVVIGLLCSSRLCVFDTHMLSEVQSRGQGGGDYNLYFRE